MPVIQGITLSLFAFAIAGFLLTILAPAPDEIRAPQSSYAVAISSGNGLRLTTRTPAGPAIPAALAHDTTGYLAAASSNGRTSPLSQQATGAPRQLTCDKVTTFAGIEVGTQCSNDSIEIAAQD